MIRCSVPSGSPMLRHMLAETFGIFMWYSSRILDKCHFSIIEHWK